MKQWVKKIVDQLDWNDLNESSLSESSKSPRDISEELATLLFLIDTYNKNLLEIDHHPIRRTRETLDDFAKTLIDPDRLKVEKTLFRFRQWFSSYHIDEYGYIQKTFDDFKNIIWDFADQLGEDIKAEKFFESELRGNLEQLREAVESNSIHLLKTKSRLFIDSYVESQSRREEGREKKIESIQNNLRTIKKQLLEANHNMRVDHLTGVFNRKSFDEQLKKYSHMFQLTGCNVSMIILDIDHFKKVNDQYGHDIGDCVIRECVRCLKEVFRRDNDFIARIGGEEFAVVLPDYQTQHAIQKANEALVHIQQQVLVHENWEIKFTVSMGIAQLMPNENVDQWIKRTDAALYESKNSGRNKVTLAETVKKISSVA